MAILPRVSYSTPLNLRLNRRRCLAATRNLIAFYSSKNGLRTNRVRANYRFALARCACRFASFHDARTRVRARIFGELAFRGSRLTNSNSFRCDPPYGRLFEQLRFLSHARADARALDSETRARSQPLGLLRSSLLSTSACSSPSPRCAGLRGDPFGMRRTSLSSSNRAP